MSVRPPHPPALVALIAPPCESTLQLPRGFCVFVVVVGEKAGRQMLGAVSGDKLFSIFCFFGFSKSGIFAFGSSSFWLTICLFLDVGRCAWSFRLSDSKPFVCCRFAGFACLILLDTELRYSLRFVSPLPEVLTACVGGRYAMRTLSRASALTRRTSLILKYEIRLPRREPYPRTGFDRQAC